MVLKLPTWVHYWFSVSPSSLALPSPKLKELSLLLHLELDVNKTLKYLSQTPIYNSTELRKKTYTIPIYRISTLDLYYIFILTLNLVLDLFPLSPRPCLKPSSSSGTPLLLMSNLRHNIPKQSKLFLPRHVNSLQEQSNSNCFILSSTNFSIVLA